MCHIKTLSPLFTRESSIHRFCYAKKMAFLDKNNNLSNLGNMEH